MGSVEQYWSSLGKDTMPIAIFIPIKAISSSLVTGFHRDVSFLAAVEHKDSFGSRYCIIHGKETSESILVGLSHLQLSHKDQKDYLKMLSEEGEW